MEQSIYSPFCQKQVNYFKKCYTSWFNCAEGGKRAGKNVLNILAWCDILEIHPDKLHLAAGVSNATAKLNIIDSNGFGLLNYFKGRCRQGKYQNKDALIIQTATGEKIILISGGGKEGDERYIKGLTIGTAYITEANECCLTFVKEVFDRTISSSNRKLFMDLNPKAPNNQFYTEILQPHQDNAIKYLDYGLNYDHFTLHDNFSFDDDKIREIIRTYDKNSVWYKRDILGQRSQAEGLIYDMFGPKNLYTDVEGGPNWDLWYGRNYSIDYGTTNPFSCHEYIDQVDLLTNIHYYHINDEYYYDSKKEKRQKEDSEYADDIKKFIDGKRYTHIVVDPSAASFKVTMRKQSLAVRGADDVINAKHEVLDGIRLVATLFRMGRLKVNKDRCPNLLNELASYIWDVKAAERGSEEPVKNADHALDECRYYCKTIIKYAPGK